MVMPLTLTLISEAFPKEKRGMAIGMWGGIAGLAVAAGPVVGGAVVQGINWHWIFWLNVPIGLALIPLCAWKLNESHGPRPRLDVPGLLLAGAGFFGLTWGLVRANSAGWASGEVIGSLLAGAVLVGLFLRWERRTLTPMLSLEMFRRPRFSSANGVSFFLYAGLFGAVFLMSQFFQSAQHLSPLQAGLRLLAWTAAPVIVSPIAGRLADRWGNRPFMVVGLLLQAVGLAWVAAVAQPHIGFAELGVALAVSGIGTSLVFPTVANEVLSAAPPMRPAWPPAPTARCANSAVSSAWPSWPPSSPAPAPTPRPPSSSPASPLPSGSVRPSPPSASWSASPLPPPPSPPRTHPARTRPAARPRLTTPARGSRPRPVAIRPTTPRRITPALTQSQWPVLGLVPVIRRSRSKSFATTR